MSEIHVLGWYDTEKSLTLKANIGDESYKLAFPKLFPDHEFVFCDTLKNFEPEILILGGGDVLYPSFIHQIQKSNAKKKYAFSVNLRPNLDLSMFDKVISRNTFENFTCLPDFAFALESNRERGKKLIRNLFKRDKCELYENVVVLVMNNFLCTKETTLARDHITYQKVCLDLAHLIDSTSASFILLPFGNGFPYNDKMSNAPIYSQCKFWKKNLLVFDSLSIQDTLDVYAGADAAINTRLHANIFSCIGGIPFIDLCHHHKTKVFMDWIDKPEWRLDYWHFDSNRAKGLINMFLKDKDYHKEQVSKINKDNKKLLESLSKTNL